MEVLSLRYFTGSDATLGLYYGRGMGWDIEKTYCAGNREKEIERKRHSDCPTNFASFIYLVTDALFSW